MYIKTYMNELEVDIQTKISLLYDFVPKIYKVIRNGKNQKIIMENIDDMCLADKYGDKSSDIPKNIWNQIRSIISLLYYREGIEYIDITPYNFNYLKTY